jgi:hypothetical protein
MKQPSEETRKITINLPPSLLDPLMLDLGLGQTETIKEALQELRRKRAYEKLLAMQGKVDFGMTWQELRGKGEDRDLGRFLTDKDA